MRGERQSAKMDFDVALFTATLALTLIGILFIFSSGINAEGVMVSREFIKQIVWAGLGTGILVLFSLLDYSRLRDYSLYIYAFFLLLLLYTRLFGRVVNGSRSWLGLGEVGVQPSEFMKIATILYLARFLDDSQRSMRPLTRFLAAIAIAGAPMALILSQPDFGTSLVFIPILLGMCLMGGIGARYIFFLIGAGSLTGALIVLPLWQTYTGVAAGLDFLMDNRGLLIAGGVLGLVMGLALAGYLIFKRRYYYWISYASGCALSGIGLAMAGRKVLKEYQIKRLIVFLDPYIDPAGSGWNIIQSMTAIGSGGWFGKGFLRGTQSHYRYLPQQSTDFIFSIISEEIGFLGSLGVFLLFGLIAWRCLYIIRNVHDRYGVLITAGVLSMVMFHFMINAGMAMGIMPITGIPLFFLSYGGSSLWAAMLGIGLVLSVYARRFRH